MSEDKPTWSYEDTGHIDEDHPEILSITEQAWTKEDVQECLEALGEIKNLLTKIFQRLGAGR